MAEHPPEAGFWTMLWLGARAQALFMWIALGYLAMINVLAVFYPEMALEAVEMLLVVFVSTSVLLLLALACREFLRMVLYQRPRHPIAQFARNIADFFRNRQAMALGMPVLVSFVIFIQAFSLMKASIPVLLAYLHQANTVAPIWSVSVQDTWWSLHLAGSTEAGGTDLPHLRPKSGFALTPDWSGLQTIRKEPRGVVACPPMKSTSTRMPPITSR